MKAEMKVLTKRAAGAILTLGCDLEDEFAFVANVRFEASDDSWAQNDSGPGTGAKP